jgi:hypothetical protein
MPHCLLLLSHFAKAGGREGSLAAEYSGLLHWRASGKIEDYNAQRLAALPEGQECSNEGGQEPPHNRQNDPEGEV